VAPQRLSLSKLATAALVASLLDAGFARAAAPSPAEQFFTAGDFDRAGAAYAQTLASAPDDVAARLGQGTVELYRDDLDAATTDLERVLAADPNNERALRLLAEAQRRRTDWARLTTIDGSQASVPFIATDPLPAVRVRVNGKHDAIFLIDTGGPSVVLDSDFAHELGLNVQAAGSGTFAGGKTAALSQATVDSISLAGATAYELTATVIPTRPISPFPNIRIDGIVGTGLLERFLATLDYPHASLVLRPRGPAASAAFEAAARGADATIVPCWLVGDHFVMAHARVNDAPSGLFLFDSGLAGGGLLPSKQLVSAAGLQLDTANATQGTGGGGTFSAIPFVAKTIAVGNAVQHAVPGIYSPDGSPLSVFPFDVQGVISHEFLKSYAYTVDFDAMKIVLDGRPR
jgi:tetratricopeptide (TPR) repeat protein